MIKLTKLPDRTLVKLTISLQPELSEALQSYAALYSETYGREERIVDLIPAMLSSFLDSDRAFARDRTGRRSKDA
jgi:hypothetical protein